MRQIQIVELKFTYSNTRMILKNYFFLLVLLTCIMSTKKISAQSVIGKWNQVTVRQYLNDGSVGSNGKPYVDTDMSTIGSVVYEFKPDNSYVMSSTSKLDADDKRVSKGSWKQSGNNLTMSTITGDQSITSSVSFQSGDLVLETIHPESKKTRKIVLIFKKL